MRTTLSLLILLLLSSTLLADKFVVTEIPEGKVLLVDTSGGTPVIEFVDVLTPDQPTPPDPIDPPDPDDLTERGKEIRDAALAVQDPNLKETAGSMAVLWQKIAEDPKFDTNTKLQWAVKMTTDRLLEDNLAADQWEPVRDLLEEQWSDVLRNSAEEDIVKDLKVLLLEASGGLFAVADNEDLVGIDLEFILQLIKWFIEEILPLIINQGGTVNL